MKEWDILGKQQPYTFATKLCNLCLNEKLRIALQNDNNMWNKRMKVLNKCKYRNMCLLEC